MTVLTTAILEDEKKPKLEDEATDAAAIPVVLTTKGAAPVVQVHNRRSLPARNPCRVFLFIITLIGLLCALGGVCYGIYHFARIGHNRPRVFCRVIENRPMKRWRIFSERAEISDDRHSVRLYVPKFMYEQRVYSSSVVLILENHGITVIKHEKSRTCFVKQIQPNLRRFFYYKRLSLTDWYRRVEEGSYLPNLKIMRRNWMAKMPHMSHQEAGVQFHPKVAEFCQDLKVFRLIEIRDRIGVVSYGGGLLPRCPLRKCRFTCPGNRYVLDRNNCRTCRCRSPPRRSYSAYKEACAPFTCLKTCTLGFKTDANGCPLCQCMIAPSHRIAKREADSPIPCKPLFVNEGINVEEGEFGLDIINVKTCSP